MTNAYEDKRETTIPGKGEVYGSVEKTSLIEDVHVTHSDNESGKLRKSKILMGLAATVLLMLISKSACSSMGLSTVATVFVPELGNITVTPMPVRANNDWSFPYRTHCCDKRMWFVEGNECSVSCISGCGQSTSCKIRCGSTCGNHAEEFICGSSKNVWAGKPICKPEIEKVDVDWKCTFFPDNLNPMCCEKERIYDCDRCGSGFSCKSNRSSCWRVIVSRIF